MNLSRSTRRLSLLALALAAVYTLVGFFVLPAIVKGQLEQRLSTELGRRVTLGRIQLNPYALSATLEDFAIQEADGTTRFLGWQRLHVNFDALSSLHGEWVLSEVTLAGFDARVRVNADQSFNFSDLLARLPPHSSTPDKPARPIRIARVQVWSAQLDLADLSHPTPFATKLGPLTFDLTEFRTVSERGAPYRFEAATETGEKLAWSGTLRADPFRSIGELVLENITLPKYAPYYASQLKGDLIAGKVSVHGRYEIDLTEGHRKLNLSDTKVEVRGVMLRERATEQTALELPSLDVTGMNVDALTQKMTVGAITLAGGHVRARREKDGSINLLAMLQPNAEPAAPVHATGAPTPAPAPNGDKRAPDVNIGEMILRDFQVEVSDLAAPRPVQFAFNSLQLSLKNLTLAEGARMPLQLSFGLAPQGTVRLDGNIGITPLQADLKLELAGIEMLTLSPYLEQFANARLTQGTLTSAAFDAHASLTAGKPVEATVSGDLKVEKVNLVYGPQNEELAGVTELSMRGLRGGTDPALSATIEELTIVGPYARVVLNSDKTLNLATLAKTSAARTEGVSAPESIIVVPLEQPVRPAAESAAASSDLPAISVGKIVITDADFRFTDRSITPAVTMAINRFSGTLVGLSTTNAAKADVDLKAVVDGTGTMAMAGKLNPFGVKRSVDLKVGLKNVDLVPLSPYCGKYAGFDLARGKLVLDVKLALDGNQIDATNVITLQEFTFGNPVKSADATTLPVRLGVALLKDSDGKIVLDVPVQGRIDDPSFKIGPVVARVVGNVLTKAATSPFSLIGAAFGGGGDELAFQEFAVGSAELQSAESKKLQTMVRALANRPALKLDLEGCFDAKADAYALKRVKLAERVRRAVWETKRSADSNQSSMEQRVVTPAEEVAAITQLYNEAFPPGTEFGTPLPPAPPTVAPLPPPPKEGFFKRAIQMVTFQKPKKPEPDLAEKENARLATAHAEAVKAATAAGLPLDEMSGRLAEAIAVDENDLRTLAQARAQRLRDYFAGEGKIAADRLLPAREQPDVLALSKGPRVFLHLQ